MKDRPHQAAKHDFQVERLIFFSDAVFAIAITLLVIDLKVPKIEGAISDQNFMIALAHELPQLSGFILSFFIIGLYWTVHHNIFGYVIRNSTKLVWINLVFLFTIALMPFSTAVYSEYSFSGKYNNLLAPFGVYVINIGLIGLMNYILNRYIFDPKNKAAEGFSSNYVKFGKLRAIAIPAVFAFALLVGFFDVNIGRMMLFLIPVVMVILHRKQKKEEQKHIHGFQK
ncbi:TMEM175 family protein [Kaistella palustris]|uniref:TMEM175 family protein n=1 Tax=Kaistella palustris TaxID=493376 RepID=UPI00040754C2|nr:TMEM175 family protein [Kaistella palustris]